MQHHLIRVARRHPSVAFGPVVGYGIGEKVAVVVEGAGCDWAWCRFKCCGGTNSVRTSQTRGQLTLQTLTGVLIPEVDNTVGA
jgi:hypothetical protein